MNRTDLQHLSRLRRREASLLLRNGHYPGAYYLVGHAVECAIKACIARRVRRHEFPDRELAIQAYSHDLERLLRLADLHRDLAHDASKNTRLGLNWSLVSGWSIESRYDRGVTRASAQDLYSACSARTHGILSWVRRRW